MLSYNKYLYLFHSESSLYSSVQSDYKHKIHQFDTIYIQAMKKYDKLYKVANI